MKYEIFIKEVIKELKEVFDTSNDYQISVNHVFKNNGVELDGVVICKKGQKIAPNIYLNTYYDMYREGMSIHNIINNIIDIYYDAIDSEFANNFELDFTFERIKDSIVYKVVNFNNNREMLKSVPFIKFLDLAIMFQCNVDSSMDGLASVRITNDHIKSWGITKEMLYIIAKKNTPRVFPCVMKNMEDVLMDLVCQKKRNMMEEKVDEEIEKMLDRVALNTSCNMYVLSNIYGINGASSILYKGVLSRFADKMMKDLYIIPSSIHEVIVIPKSKDMEASTLKDMVRDVNETQVPIEDVLANSVYEYSRESKELRLL